jgi:alkyl hydroperoxide reductase subunit F
MHDLIVVGGGPAGLAATVYAVRQRLNVSLITDQLGGKAGIRSEFPGIGDLSVIRGRELVERFKNELGYLDIAHRLDRVRTVAAQGAGAGHPTFTVTTDGGESLETRSVIVASGCHFEPPRIAGADKYLLRGIGYSAISYAHLFLDRVAVVIGSGPRAVRSALQLAYSAQRVYLLPLEGTAGGGGTGAPGAPGAGGESARGEGARGAPGSSAREEAAREDAYLAALENVTILKEHRVLGFDGDQYAREVRVQGPDGAQRTIAADGFFLESEAAPNSGLAADLVDRDDRGYIRVDSRNNTRTPGIYAAGDVTNIHREQVLVAIGEGAKASLSVQEYLFARRR